MLDLGIPVLLSANRQFHKLLVGGVPVEYQKDGETRGDFVRLIDWDAPSPHPLSRGERGFGITPRCNINPSCDTRLSSLPHRERD